MDFSDSAFNSSASLCWSESASAVNCAPCKLYSWAAACQQLMPFQAGGWCTCVRQARCWARAGAAVGGVGVGAGGGGGGGGGLGARGGGGSPGRRGKAPRAGPAGSRRAAGG